MAARPDDVGAQQRGGRELHAQVDREREVQQVLRREDSKPGESSREGRSATKRSAASCSPASEQRGDVLAAQKRLLEQFAGGMLDAVRVPLDLDDRKPSVRAGSFRADGRQRMKERLGGCETCGAGPCSR